MEWFNNIGKWFQENCGNFLMVLQTIDVAGVVAAIVLVIRQVFATKSNTSNVKLLNASLQDNKSLKTKLETVEENQDRQDKAMQALIAKQNDIIDAQDKMLSKMNSMLDVYALVYQTIKNEDTRVAVNNILMNARYNETATREALTKKIEELQSNVKQLTEDTLDRVNDVVEQSKQLIVADDKSIPRG